MHCLPLSDSKPYDLLCRNPDAVEWRRYDRRSPVGNRATMGQPTSVNGAPLYCHVETPSYTFTLPDLSSFPDDFRSYLEKELIETSSLKSLESSGHLNWWASESSCQKLWPLATKGDGNCLLHAASLGMWGFHDRFLILRKALHLLLTKGSRRHALWRRWRWQQTHENGQCGLEYTEAEWSREWEFLVDIASPRPRNKKSDEDRHSESTARNGIREQSDRCDIYESLDQLHVFALAHVLKRPIVIIADTVLRDSSGEAFSPILFGGIYLPLECSSSECHRSPLVLCFDTAHFSALVTMQQKDCSSNTPAIIPITYRDRTMLPLHFACDPGPDFTWWKDEADEKIACQAALDDSARLSLITRYMDIEEIAVEKPAKAATLASSVHSHSSVAPFGSSDSNCKRKSWSRSMGNLFLESYITGSKEKLLKLRARLRRRATPELVCTFFGTSDPDAMTASHRPWEAKMGRPPTSTVSIQDVRSNNLIVGAKIETQTHHQLMDEMINSYLTTARHRFEEERNGKPAAARRERFSGDLSNAKFNFTCINGSCNRTASHETNFLCGECFEVQTQILESFTANSGTRSPVQLEVEKGQMANNDVADQSVCLNSNPNETHSCTVANSKFYVSMIAPPIACLSGTASNDACPTNWSTNKEDVSSSCLTVVRFDVVKEEEAALMAKQKAFTLDNDLQVASLSPSARRPSVELKYEVTRQVDSAGFTRYRVADVAEESLGCSNSLCSRYIAGHSTTCGLCITSRM
ncbi:Otud7a protein [Trichuris trichiura]|uniref:ubiquitinyl hydrolase 1 n=1 Tax=Trichuris trichiura TaxID=36087 RepID=A0A077Z1H6_TRITR|nr:Otud7a protein [Trichuris trichiura]